MIQDRRRFLKTLAVTGGGWASSALVAAPANGGWSATGKEPPRVALDSGAAEPVRFAAAELQRYLEKILGVPLPSSGAGATKIVLRQVSDPQLGDEGFEISSDDRTLTIAGSPLGIVYGVFEFLRRYAGCQFSGLGPDCEFVPHRERIEVNVRRLQMKPKLWYRGYQFFYAEPLDLVIHRLDWMVKNGLNYVMFTPKQSLQEGEPVGWVDPSTGQFVGGPVHPYTEGWWKLKVESEVFKRGLKLDFNHHNLFYWLPPERHFQDHPEWYPLVDGRRTMKPSQLSMCTSNEDAVKTVVENVKRYLRDNPQVKIVGVIVEDGSGWCQCENCRRNDPDPNEALRPDFSMQYKTPEGENKSKCLRYARLVNHVAREIRTEFPDVLVGHSAYVDIQWPPRGIQMEPNTVTWVAIYWRDGAQPLSADSPSPVSRFFVDILRQWRPAHLGHLIAYEYYMGMEAQKSLPYPQSEVICRDWPYLKKIGIEGATIQSWSANHNAYALNNLAFARSGWEDQVDHQALFDGFLSGMFGSVASEIRPIYERLLAAWRRIEKEGPAVSPWMENYDGSKTSGGSVLPDAKSVMYLLDQVGADVLHGAVERARQKASDDRERRQVEHFAAIVAYWRMAADALTLEMKAKRAERQGDRALAASLLNQAVDQSERVMAYLKTLPQRGWISVATFQQWARVTSSYRKRARALERA